jgi:hypothetical protein
MVLGLGIFPGPIIKLKRRCKMPRGTIPTNKAKKGKTAEQCRRDMMGTNNKGIAGGKPMSKKKRPSEY